MPASLHDSIESSEGVVAGYTWEVLFEGTDQWWWGDSEHLQFNGHQAKGALVLVTSRSGDISGDPDVRGRTGIWSSGMRVLALEPEGLPLPTWTPEEDL